MGWIISGTCGIASWQNSARACECGQGRSHLPLKYSQDSWKCHQPGRDEPVLDLFKAVIERDDRIMIIPVSLHNEILERERAAGHQGNENTETCSLQEIAAYGTNSALAEAGTAPQLAPGDLYTTTENGPLAGEPGRLYTAGRLQPESLALAGLLIYFQLNLSKTHLIHILDICTHFYNLELV